MFSDTETWNDQIISYFTEYSLILIELYLRKNCLRKFTSPLTAAFDNFRNFSFLAMWKVQSSRGSQASDDLQR